MPITGYIGVSISNSKNCYFFKNGSITTIDIQSLFSKQEAPKLYFTIVRTTKKTYPTSTPITISFAESRIINILFSSLSFGNRELFFQYAIIKNDTFNWRDFNGDQLNLLNLEYGDYIIKIRAKTSSSSYSEPIACRIRILGPFWLTWWFITLIFCITALLLSLLVIITRRIVLQAAKKKNLRMELELKAIYSQINPHFIFNTLNSALLLVRKKRTEEAYVHIFQFSRLLRNYIKSSRNKLITIADEINNLRDYLELQQTRFGNKFEYTIFVEDAINPHNVRIPSLLLQPFVENALKHGLLQKKEAGHLKIEFIAGINKNELICNIEDDGIGRRKAASETISDIDKESSYGDLLIQDLIRIFNKYEQMSIAIKYIDKAPPLTGTTVVILIKNPPHDQ